MYQIENFISIDQCDKMINNFYLWLKMSHTCIIKGYTSQQIISILLLQMFLYMHMYNKRKKKTKYFFLTLTRKLKSSLSLCLTFKAWIIMYVYVHSKMKKKYGLTDLVTIQVLRLWEGKCHFGNVFSLKFLQRDPKKFIIQNLLDFFF